MNLTEIHSALQFFILSCHSLHHLHIHKICDSYWWQGGGYNLKVKKFLFKIKDQEIYIDLASGEISFFKKNVKFQIAEKNKTNNISAFSIFSIFCLTRAAAAEFLLLFKMYFLFFLWQLVEQQIWKPKMLSLKLSLIDHVAAYLINLQS